MNVFQLQNRGITWNLSQIRCSVAQIITFDPDRLFGPKWQRKAAEGLLNQILVGQYEDSYWIRRSARMCDFTRSWQRCGHSRGAVHVLNFHCNLLRFLRLFQTNMPQICSDCGNQISWANCVDWEWCHNFKLFFLSTWSFAFVLDSASTSRPPGQHAVMLVCPYDSFQHLQNRISCLTDWPNVSFVRCSFSAGWGHATTLRSQEPQQDMLSRQHAPTNPFIHHPDKKIGQTLCNSSINWMRNRPRWIPLATMRQLSHELTQMILGITQKYCLDSREKFLSLFLAVEALDSFHHYGTFLTRTPIIQSTQFPTKTTILYLQLFSRHMRMSVD